MRQFVWDFHPSGFFTRLLVRLMHLQIAVPVSWANAAVLLSRSGDEAAFLQMKRENDKHYLEVSCVVVAPVIVAAVVGVVGLCTSVYLLCRLLYTRTKYGQLTATHSRQWCPT